MNKTQTSKNFKATTEEMLPEYDFDYSKARPNRFADRMKEGPLVVLVDPDLAEVFTTPESVNNALRALISAMPQPSKK
ncbi:MAG: hypothetical protein L6R45_28320 [Anaerolineae bacterium]|nr:hypothetical protein [Anaerolineae bacterium]